ncbi:MAG TPA: LytTR family DNA-binding domain-containing protein [Candidatus Mcinerneyibacteriales bacterium]|nr:LytTR family DNA-binding domain-containing protein [Candidatus Mcinerneyibacteriales bacterium]HPJ70840.1 LytTR family DNA-binding domain-containing protein [Candidatus Mcinerneyibacteriales bacterium]HPQ88887.1 LytTR family DNA-binding domain-containing protein [Candidatus Mcinerneyibacteriales bacterium]
MIEKEALIVSSQRHLASRLQTELARIPGISVRPRIHEEGRLSFNLRQRSPDLIFMSLKNESSLWVDLFLHRPPFSQVIATTPDPALAPRAFLYNCADVLTSPFRVRDLRRAVARALTRRFLWLRGQERHFSPLVARKKGVIRFFNPEEVLFFKAEDKVVFLYTDKERYFSRFSLSQLEARLNPLQFCRVRRNVIVALHAIREVEIKGSRGLFLSLRGSGMKIRAGRRYIPYLKERLLL